MMKGTTKINAKDITTPIINPTTQPTPTKARPITNAREVILKHSFNIFQGQAKTTDTHPIIALIAISEPPKSPTLLISSTMNKILDNAKMVVKQQTQRTM